MIVMIVVVEWNAPYRRFEIGDIPKKEALKWPLSYHKNFLRGFKGLKWDIQYVSSSKGSKLKEEVGWSLDGAHFGGVGDEEVEVVVGDG
ncbi:hypothetical protein Tco_0897461 [Tanacetum coccineum]